jgi:hypothetical protein
MDRVGEEYEWPKKRQGWWVVQLLSASCRIPVGLGNVVIGLYISVACGRDGGKESGTVPVKNYDYDRELSSIDTVPTYILSKFYVFGTQGKCQLR